jgi:hypothetical protein
MNLDSINAATISRLRLCEGHGRDYVLARCKAEGRKRGSISGIDANGNIWPTQIVDGLVSVVDEPDVYHFMDGD